MIAKRCLLVLAIMGLTFLFIPPAHPALELEIETLRGLTEMCVLVEYLDKEIKRELPFDENQIRVDVELKLRTAGIKVLSKDQWRITSGMPYLYVILDIRRLPNMPMFYFSIDIHLVQLVYLERNHNILAPSRTWICAGMGCAEKNNTSKIRNHLKDTLDIFINDYLSVNPKGGN